MANANHNIQFDGATIVTTLTNSSLLTDYVLCEFHSKRIIGLSIYKKNVSERKRCIINQLLQLCHGNRCIIIQLLHLDAIPDSLRNILSDRSIRFIGMDGSQDIARLDRDYGLKCWFAHELLPPAEEFFGGARLLPSFQKIAGFSIEELDQVNSQSDWSANILINDQIKVATMNAYICFKMGYMMFG
ncbi:hypothetical protein MKW94_009566 [Papaver nudicaule]|uniref:3'-5' exonuclease domain-containing protein n=1 Tax=Papaver nudicaule TaxID=74823 RepID=A0AA41VV36_PAPNU|nr:hypothetical protein [Papaver nudicaule]